MSDIEDYDALCAQCSARHALANVPTPATIDGWRADLRVVTERFLAGIRKDERERCAKLCEQEARRLEATGNEIPRYGARVAEQLAVRIRSGELP